MSPSASSVEPRTSANSRLHGISAPARCLTMSLKHMAQYFGFFSHGPLPITDITLAHPPCNGDAQSLQWASLGKNLRDVAAGPHQSVGAHQDARG